MRNYDNAGIVNDLRNIADDLEDFRNYFHQHSDIDLTDEEERAADDVKRIDILTDWLDSMGKIVDFGKVEVKDEWWIV